LSVSSRAQAVYGSVFGTVTDPKGARVVGAVVTVTDLTRNVTTTAKTNESGNYTVTRLIPGKYRVKVEQQGYRIAIQEIEVKADVAARGDFLFKIETVAEQVTVTTETERGSLKTDRADVATNLDQQQIEGLPNFDRNFTKFVLLSPGTQQRFWRHAPSENPQGSIQIVVNGQHFSGTTYQLDGADNRDPILGIIVINPKLESVTEAKITAQNYDAEFGMAIAGVVATQTRSGTNEPHGSAFLFRRNDVTIENFDEQDLMSRNAGYIMVSIFSGKLSEGVEYVNQAASKSSSALGSQRLSILAGEMNRIIRESQK